MKLENLKVTALLIVFFILGITVAIADDAPTSPTVPTIPVDEPSTMPLEQEIAEAPDIDFGAPNLEAAEWLRQLEQSFASVQTVKGEFTQERKSEIFLEVIEARGEFFFQKDSLFRANHELKEEGKWNKDNELLISGDELWIYSPLLEQAEKFTFKQSDSEAGRMHQMFLGFGPKTEEVLKAYDVTVIEESDEIVTLEFVPRDPDIAADILWVRITFGKKELLPRTIKYYESTDDQTTIQLRDIEKNAKLPKDIFKPDWPAGTEIIERN